jgi:hypothetical protein
MYLLLQIPVYACHALWLYSQINNTSLLSLVVDPIHLMSCISLLVLGSPARVFEHLLRLLFPWIWQHGSLSLLLLLPLSVMLLGLLCGRPTNGPVQLTEDVGFDGCTQLLASRKKMAYHVEPTIYTVCTQYVRPLDSPACRTPI